MRFSGYHAKRKLGISPALGVTAAILILVVVGMLAPKVFAAPHTGYFTGNSFNGSGRHLISPDYSNKGSKNLNNVNDIESFITVIDSCLFNKDCSSYNGPIAASYIILTMMGDSNHSVSRAKTLLGNWKAMVRSYDASGLVNFNVTKPYNRNTMMVSHDSPRDVVSYTGSITVKSIVFSETNGTEYAIKKDCANPVGGIKLKPARVQGYVDLTSGGQVNSGGTVHAGISNVKPGAGVFKLDTAPSKNGEKTTMKLTGVDSKYKVAGYKWCTEKTGRCSTLDKNITSGSSFSRALKSGTTYSMRWYVEPKVTTAVVSGYIVNENGNHVTTGAQIKAGNSGWKNPTVASGGTAKSKFVLTSSAGNGKTIGIKSIGKGYKLTGYKLCATNGWTSCGAKHNLSAGSSGSFKKDLKVGKTYYMRWIAKKEKTPPPPPDPVQHRTNCPLDLTISANSLVSFTLRDTTSTQASQDGISTGGPPTYTTARGGIHKRYVTQRKTIPTGVKDISSGSGNVSLSVFSPDKNNKVTKTYQKTKVDYKPFVKNYPYDQNRAQVSYKSVYQLWQYRASYNIHHYKCDNGSTTTKTNGCTRGGSLLCSGAAASHSDGACYYRNGSKRDKNGKCIKGTYYPTLGGCANRSTGHSCSYGYYRSGNNPTRCYQDYTGTAQYKYNQTPYYQSGDKQTDTSTSNGYSMKACYDRQFDVSWSPKPTNGSLSPTAEDPTSASFSASVKVHFYGEVDTKNLRKASKVKLNYGGNIDSPSGISPYGNCSSGAVSVTSAKVSSDEEVSSRFTITCSIKAPPLQVGQSVCAEYVVSPQQGKIRSSGTGAVYDSMFSKSEEITASPCTNKLTNQPYAHFFGNDVFAGGSVADKGSECTVSAAKHNGGINTWLGVVNRGSSSQYAALALGRISASGFASAYLRDSSPSYKSGLTFANTISPEGQLGTSHCAPNYYKMKPAVAENWKGTFGSDGQQIYKASAGTLNVPMVPNGVSATIYVDGDATINRNVNYQADNWFLMGNKSNIPSLYIIASGNIKIGPNVSDLHGVYVAQSGAIDTCYTHDFNGCRNQLVVHGSFIADKVNLYRTFSSLRNSAVKERPDLPFQGESDKNNGRCNQGDNGTPSKSNTGRNGGTSYDCAAEIFMFNPANYLASPALPQMNGGNNIKFDAVSNLSPVL